MIRTSISFRLVFLVLLALVFQSCATVNPIGAAETIEQKAFASYGTFVIAQEQAAKLIASGQLDNNTIIRIGHAEDVAKTVADSLMDSTLEFEKIKDDYLSGGDTSEEKFINAMNSLDGWVTQMAPLLVNLKSAIKREN